MISRKLDRDKWGDTFVIKQGTTGIEGAKVNVQLRHCDGSSAMRAYNAIADTHDATLTYRKRGGWVLVVSLNESMTELDNKLHISERLVLKAGFRVHLDVKGDNNE